MPAPPEEQLKAAQAALAGLQAKQEELVSSIAALQADRKKVALAAHTGNAGAAEKLRALQEQTAQSQVELEDLDHAIADAREAVDQAEAAVHRAADVEKAKRRILLAGRLRRAGVDADEALKAFARAMAEILAVQGDPDGVGVAQLSLAFMRPNVTNAVHSALTPLQPFLPVAERRAIAPSARQEIGHLLATWAARIEEEAQQVIEAPKTRRAA